MRRAVALLGIIAVGLAMGGCSAGARQPFIKVPLNPDGISREALLQGALEDLGGCLAVRTDDGDVFVLALAGDATWTEPATLTYGTDLTVGQQVEFGGGHSGSVSDLSARGIEIPDGCPDEADVWETQ